MLSIMVGDITTEPADAIVNAANSAFANGGGVDGAIRAAAGPELSGEMRRRYPAGTPTGTAVATDAYALPARWLIHKTGIERVTFVLRPSRIEAFRRRLATI